jgi:hypothetical protein
LDLVVEPRLVAEVERPAHGGLEESSSRTEEAVIARLEHLDSHRPERSPSFEIDWRGARLLPRHGRRTVTRRARVTPNLKPGAVCSAQRSNLILGGRRRTVELSSTVLSLVA